MCDKLWRIPVHYDFLEKEMAEQFLDQMSNAGMEMQGTHMDVSIGTVEYLGPATEADKALKEHPARKLFA